MNVFILLVTCCSFALADFHPFYRHDYIFYEPHEAFFKVHLGSESGVWEPISALNVCNNEGSRLYYPKSIEELHKLKHLLNFISKNTSEILVGAHSSFGTKELTTVEDGTMSQMFKTEEVSKYNGSMCVYVNVENSNFSVKNCSPEIMVPAFMCSRKLEYDTLCPNSDLSYIYEDRTKKCYKYNNKPMNWSDAMQTCFMEGGSLLVTKDDKENKIVKEILKHKIETGVAYIHVGFRKFNVDNQYYTVKGELLTEHSNYQDFFNVDKKDICGAFSNYNTEYFVTTTRLCKSLSPFICELKARLPN